MIEDDRLLGWQIDFSFFEFHLFVPIDDFENGIRIFWKWFSLGDL